MAAAIVEIHTNCIGFVYSATGNLLWPSGDGASNGRQGCQIGQRTWYRLSSIYADRCRQKGHAGHGKVYPCPGLPGSGYRAARRRAPSRAVLLLFLCSLILWTSRLVGPEASPIYG